jgi:hypothetical protein
MSESTLTQLKILVERAVRPVRASTARKRRMREELLAHVVCVFEEEGARLGDDRAALERTALRFGNPAEVTSRLQESVPAGDSTARFFEGRPGEATLWVLIRIACAACAWELGGVAAVLLAADWVAVLPREHWITFGYVFLASPVWFFGLAFLTDWIEKGVYDPAGFPASGLLGALSVRCCSCCCSLLEQLGPIGRRTGTLWVQSHSRACWRPALWVSPGVWHGRTPRVGVTTRNGGACRSRYLRKSVRKG